MGIRKQTKYWTTRDGTRIRICDMCSDHILNTMAMLERFAWRKLFQFDRFAATVSGEEAQNCIESNIDRMYSLTSEELAEEMFPIYENLSLELDRRAALCNSRDSTPF